MNVTTQAAPLEGAPSFRRDLSRKEESIVAARALVPLDPTHRAWLLGAFALYFFAVCAVALLTSTPGAVLLVPALAVFLVVRVYPLLRPVDELAWFHPLVFVTAYSLVGLLRNFTGFALGIEAHQALPGWSTERLSQVMVFELLLTTLGLLCYYLGFFTLPAPRAPRIRFKAPRHLQVKVILSVGASVAAFFLYIRSQGGLHSHILSWGESRHVALEGESYWILLSRLGVLGCTVWLASSRSALRNALFWGCVAVSLAITFLASGGRAAVVYPVAFGLVIWMLVHGRFSMTRLMVLAVTGLFLISVLGEFRRGTLKGRVDWEAITHASPVEAVHDVATGELVERATTSDGVLPILALVPQRVPHLWGSSYVAFALLPVPRALWPEKPGMIGGQVGQTFFGRQGGIPPGPVGEAYWNFNVPGVAVVFLLFGIFHRWLLRFYLAHRGQPGAAIVYGVSIFLANPSTPSLKSYTMALVSLAVLMLAFGMVSLPNVLRASRAP